MTLENSHGRRMEMDKFAEDMDGYYLDIRLSLERKLYQEARQHFDNAVEKAVQEKIAALESSAARYKEAFIKYGTHSATCQKNFKIHKVSCDCGFAEALSPAPVEAKRCTCGESSPDRLVVHRTDGPCYLRERQSEGERG